MPDTYVYPPADPEVAGIVGQLADGLQKLQETLEQCREQLEQGYSLGQLRGITDEEYDALYRIARDLCDKGDFHHALPVALQLALHNPANYRYPFLAGACLQRLGQPASAAHFYRVALQLDESDAASAYRFGECLEALGQREDACHLYQWAIELSRGNFALRTLQDMASSRLAQLDAARQA